MPAAEQLTLQWQEPPASTPGVPAPEPTGCAAPATPLTELLTPARFEHPHANREALLGDARVAYQFVRGQRRTIGFVVGPEGLTVRAPRWVAARDIDAAVQEKAGWILRKLTQAQEQQARRQQETIAWRDGSCFPLLGRCVLLRLDPTHAFAGAGAVLEGFDAGAQVQPVLRLAVPQAADEARIRDAAQAWLMRHARQIFLARMAHFAPQLGVGWSRLTLSNATTRWGSASANGAIRLNWRLVHFRLEIIDYVVVHELAHLRVMDHSPRFWNEVGRVLPDYAQRRRLLRSEAAPHWD